MENNKNLLNEMRTSDFISEKYLRFLTKKSEEIGTNRIAESVLIATSEANVNAMKLEIPVVYLENDLLIELSPNGTKIILSKIQKSKLILKSHFKI